MNRALVQQNGFTLLEALIAMVLLTIGILSLFPMQITAIRGNAQANGLTTASTQVQSQIEQILSWSAKDPRLHDTNAITIPGASAPNHKADGSRTSGRYTIYWDGTPVMDSVDTSRRVGMNVQVHAVWQEQGRRKQITMIISKPV